MTEPIKVGKMRYFHSGIRMLLHARAPEALNPELVIPDLAREFRNSNNWLGDYLLNAGLRSNFDNDLRILFLAVIRRVSHSLDHFTFARERTLRYAQWDCSGAIPAKDYFGAIEGWENCLLQFQILVEVMNKWRPDPALSRIYKRGENTVTERMCEISNRVKHAIQGQIQASDLTPLWLERDGVAALDGYRVSYTELADELRDACDLAQRMTDPATFFERLRTKTDGEDDAASESTSS